MSIVVQNVSRALVIQYVRVTEANTECPEVGPYFPFTSGTAVQMGMTRNDDILLAPDWILIGSVIAGAVGVMLLILIALVRILFLFVCLISKFSTEVIHCVFICNTVNLRSWFVQQMFLKIILPCSFQTTELLLQRVQYYSQVKVTFSQYTNIVMFSFNRCCSGSMVGTRRHFTSPTIVGYRSAATWITIPLKAPLSDQKKRSIMLPCN